MTQAPKKELPAITEEARVLYRAEDIIDERGWCQGTGQNYREVCVMKAVLLAAGIPWFGDKRAVEYRKLIGHVMPGDGWIDPVDWNDYTCSSPAEASAMLRRVAGSLG